VVFHFFYSECASCNECIAYQRNLQTVSTLILIHASIARSPIRNALRSALNHPNKPSPFAIREQKRKQRSVHSRKKTILVLCRQIVALRVFERLSMVTGMYSATA
jgi:hypothetical protein